MVDKTRLEMLERIDEINKQVGFVGSRGEMYMNDSLLAILLNELEEQIRSKKEGAA